MASPGLASPAARAFRALALTLVSSALVGVAAAEPLGIGDRLEEVALADQHGEERHIDAGTRFVLFSRDMDGGDLLKRALADADAESLARVGAVYVADISRMPGLVARLFAVPSMRRRAYPILLDRDGEATADWPSAEGRATVIRLDALGVAEVRQLEDPVAVARAIGLEAPPEE